MPDTLWRMFVVVLGAARRFAGDAIFVMVFLAGFFPAVSRGSDALGPVAAAAADHAVRVVLIDLRLPESPTPGDYEIAARMLGALSEFAPGDIELARLETAAAFGTGDPRLLAEATARVVRLDPSDTVAQLRLITARIAQRQTAEERLEVYERLLGPRGVSIDHTVRSRLALDAALIYRERGDIDGFLRSLTLASDLDPTNKEAQHLATSYFAEYAGDDAEGLAGLLEMQLKMMWADPIDPNVHLGISRQLAIEGAMRESARFHANGMAILTRAGLLQPRHKVQNLALLWLLDGPRVVLDTIERELAVARDNARIKYELDLQRDVPDRLLVPPEEVFLDPLFEKIRIIAALDAMDRQALQVGLGELDRYAQHQFNQVQQATRLDDPQTRAKAFKEFAASLVSLQFMRALANVELQKIAASMPQLPRVIGEEEWNRMRRPLEAWLALRSGDLEKTRSYLREIGTRSSIMRVCNAELLVAEGRDIEAAAEYEYILRTDPFVPYGAWARSRAMELTGRTDPVTPAGKRMQRLVAEVPESLDVFLRDPTELMSLNIEPVAESFGPGERARLRISMVNTTPWPLSIGPNRTISSRFLLGVSIDDSDMLASAPQPVVVDLDRRLRLNPAEELVVEANVEQGVNGMIFDSADRGIIRMRWQGWQSPTINNSGAYVAGPFSLSDSTEKFIRATRPESRLPVSELAALVREAATPDEVVVAIESSAAWLRRGGRPGGDELASVLVGRYMDAGEDERMLMLAALPSESHVPAMAVFDEAVRREAGGQDRLSRTLAALALFTRAKDADDPLLAAASESGDAGLVSLASLVSARLAEGRVSYATAGAGIDALSGASKVSALKNDEGP